jgi:hypothetical protein
MIKLINLCIIIVLTGLSSLLYGQERAGNFTLQFAITTLEKRTPSQIAIF